MKKLLSFFFLSLAPLVMGAGDSATPAVTPSETIDIDKWHVYHIVISRNPALMQVTMVGKKSGQWIKETVTYIDLDADGARINGWGVDHGGISATCSKTFSDIVKLDADGIRLDRSLLTGCGFGS